jgi:hypothetical protein
MSTDHDLENDVNKQSEKLHSAVKQTLDELQEQKAMQEIFKDQNWEYLEEFFKLLCEKVISLSKFINDYLGKNIVQKYLDEEEKKKLHFLIRGFESDVVRISQAIAEVHGKHNGRTGPVKDADENIELIRLYEQYLRINEVSMRVLLVCFTDIVSMFSIAEQRYNEALQAQKDTQSTDAPIEDAQIKPIDPTTH